MALAAGFAWYERTRPDARILALVATLAALAALGRVAFAALPNVKPTTDIVLIAGYALGGAPGFVVGAVTGLVSNFFFGQGPWTVWQMAAWGVTGLIGAGLARAHGAAHRALAAGARVRAGRLRLRRRPGRRGLGHLQRPQQRSSSGSTSARARASTSSTPPAASSSRSPSVPRWLRALRRFRGAPGGDLAAGPEDVGPARHGLSGRRWAADTTVVADARAAATPSGYLLSAQNRDGGFGAGPGSPSSGLYSGWAALGLAAEGVSPGAGGRYGPSVLAYIAATLSSNLDPGSVERTILVVHAAGGNPSSFAGRDLVAALQGAIRPGRLGERADEPDRVCRARSARGRRRRWARRRCAGWPPSRTATVVLASGPPVRPATSTTPAQCSRPWTPGGPPGSSGGRSDSCARHRIPTGAALSARRPLQRPVDGVGDSGAHRRRRRPSGVRRGRSVADYLGSLVAPDGHVRYAAGIDQTPVWVTAQAVMALAGRPLPLAPCRLRRVHAAARARAAKRPRLALHRCRRAPGRRRPPRPHLCLVGIGRWRAPAPRRRSGMS